MAIARQQLGKHAPMAKNPVACRTVASSNLETDDETIFAARQQIFNQVYTAIAG